MNIYKNKKVLVTGGTGLIGKALTNKLINMDAEVRVASLDHHSLAHPSCDFKHMDLTDISNCKKACENIDYVFNLVGIKGCPAMTMKKPVSFFDSTILFNTNMLKCSFDAGVKRYLYTSTIGVYAPAKVFHEDDIWNSFPSHNDWYSGWAKRMGELQVEAYGVEYGWKDIVIVRPANTYGVFDNMSKDNALVIPALVKRVVDGENPLVVWGDGSAVRDFVFADDVADGMLLAMEKGMGDNFNLGSGMGVSVKQIVDIILRNMDNPPDVIWDKSKPSGDKIRLMDISKAKEKLGYNPKVSIDEGIKRVMDWYNDSGDVEDRRYNVFKA